MLSFCLRIGMSSGCPSVRFGVVGMMSLCLSVWYRYVVDMCRYAYRHAIVMAVDTFLGKHVGASFGVTVAVMSA